MLLPASFRGATFAVTSSDAQGGRRIALHQYPGRDDPWAEDMGRAPRRIHLRGFVLDGDILLGKVPIGQQRATLIKALEKKGEGALSHPTLGSLQVVVERWSVGEELDAQRRSAVELECTLSGKQAFPAAVVSSSGITAAARLLDLATKIEGVVAIGLALISGGTRADAAGLIGRWANKALTLSNDATALHRLAALLPGSFGRFAAGGNAGLTGQTASPYAASATISDLVPLASAQRVAIRAAASALVDAVNQADLAAADNIPAASATLVAALAASCADPADTIRLMGEVLQFSAGGIDNNMTRAITTIIRRSAAAAMTRAAAAYQPSSADDAAARIAALAPALDLLATEAADQGNDQSYAALRSCRGAIVADLRARGATLAQIRTFTFGQAMPALALAQTIYADSSRADQLLSQTGAPHPLFLPTSFDALAA